MMINKTVFAWSELAISNKIISLNNIFNYKSSKILFSPNNQTMAYILDFPEIIFSRSLFCSLNSIKCCKQLEL